MAKIKKITIKIILNYSEINYLLQNKINYILLIYTVVINLHTHILEDNGPYTMWDRTKDEQLVKDILSKKRTGYSMGATVNNFICSVCGKIDNLDAHSCEHMRPPGGIWGDEKRLGMQLCTGVCYFETSSLDNEPANPTAFSDDIFV